MAAELIICRQIPILFSFSSHLCVINLLIFKGLQFHSRFYGMSSESAMAKHSGGVAKYRAAEGKTVLLPYRGSVHNTISDILGGVRSTCTYVGAAQLKELTKRTTFIRVQEQENNVFGKE
ncbi:IMP dehydrogenase [Vibrio breoganii]|nr:IMP dehydrogenase [Vibrio breoganii]